MQRRGLLSGSAFGSFALLPLLLIIPAIVCTTVAPGPVDQDQSDSPPVSAPLETQPVLPTLTVPAPADAAATAPAPADELAQTTPQLVELYQSVSPGVVNIQVVVSRGGQFGAGAGSGFVLDDQGHIVTNDHVVAGAEEVVIVFFDGTEVPAEVVGTDDDSDLAVVRAEELPAGVHPLLLGDSDNVQVGEWVIAIGNPFGLSSSMSIGIVSAVGRAIPSITGFQIPEAIQTDAAINPGNSGGPLINLRGEVVGVNAQIETASGLRANSGVGFAIPANFVRRVAPALIANGVYQWPWLGVAGGDVDLAVAEANNLPTQDGAYIDCVEPGGPADEAGLRGSTNTTAPVGGDIVIQADGQPVEDFYHLLSVITSHAPGDQVALTILRDGEQQQLSVILGPRPEVARVCQGE